jgi:hypothetical protein
MGFADKVPAFESGSRFFIGSMKVSKAQKPAKAGKDRARARARAYRKLVKEADEFVRTGCKDPHALAVVIDGDSMEPAFKPGDRVVFQPNTKPQNGDAVLLKLKDGRVFFKWYERNGNVVRLTSENPKYAPFEVAPSQIKFAMPAWEMMREVTKRKFE